MFNLNLSYHCFALDALSEATESWYDEIKLYNFARPGFSIETGHFTALVWRETTQVGFGIGLRIDGTFKCVFTVANYWPSGNINTPQYFQANVLKPRYTNYQNRNPHNKYN